MSLSYFLYLQYDVRMDQDWSKERLRKGGQLRQQTRHQQVGRQVVGGHQLNLLKQEVEEGTWIIRITISFNRKLDRFIVVHYFSRRTKMVELTKMWKQVYWRIYS